MSVEAQPAYEQESKQAIREVFNKFDFDGSGDISYKEITSLASALGHIIQDEDVIQIFRDLDTNGDNRISFEEFWVWWSSGKPSKLESLVYLKLKAMQLLRRAHSEFTRLGGSLENKFDKSVDTHYVALNYGSSPGQVSLHLIVNVDHESSEEIKKEAMMGCRQSELNTGNKDFFGLVVRMRCTNITEARKALQKALFDAKRIVALLNGPESARALEVVSFDVLESAESGEAVLFVNLRRTHIESFLTEEVIGKLKDITKQNSVTGRLEMHLGVKNSLTEVVKNPSMSFTDWLMEGFLVEAKLTLDKHVLQSIKKLLRGFIAALATKDKNSDEKQNKLLAFALASLLRSSKIHLTFKDVHNVSEFLEGLGVRELSKKAPTCIEMFKEFMENLYLDRVVKAESSQYPVIKSIIEFLNNYVDGSDFNVYLITDSIVAHAKIVATGLGDLLQQYSPKTNS